MAEETKKDADTTTSKTPEEKNKVVDPKETVTTETKGKTNTKKTDTVEQKLVEDVKGLFEENEKLKKLFVAEDGQAFLESNLQYALRHCRIKKLKLFEINNKLKVEEYSEPENND